MIAELFRSRGREAFAPRSATSSFRQDPRAMVAQAVPECRNTMDFALKTLASQGFRRHEAFDEA